MQIINNVVWSTYLYRTDVNPFQWELKKINNNLIDKLKNTIKKRWFDAPLYIWYEHNNYILDWHQRLIALNQLSDEWYLLEDDKIPVVYIKAETEKEAKEKVMEYNSRYSEFNEEVLLQWITWLDMDDIDLWFTIDLPNDEYDESTEDEVPELVQDPIVQIWDVYQLWSHRLVCGDATNQDHIQLLMDNKQADMVWTDPPYNVDYSWSGKKLKSKKIENDNINDDEFKNLLINSFTNLKNNTKDNWWVYIRHNRRNQDIFKQGIEIAWRAVKTQLIWNKPSLGLGWGDYRPKHELCYFWWVKNQEQTFYIEDHEVAYYAWDEWKLEFYGDRTNSTVIDMKREKTNNYLHPTQKPVELCERQIKNSSKKWDIILDLFAWSWVAVITAEKFNRSCYAMDLDPVYVQAIIKRYHIYTKGNKPIKCLNRDFNIKEIFTT